MNLYEIKRNGSRYVTQIIIKEIASDSEDSKHFHRKFFLHLIVRELLLLVNQVDDLRTMTCVQRTLSCMGFDGPRMEAQNLFTVTVKVGQKLRAT